MLLGFLVSYLLFFLRPIFLNPQQAMFLPRYVPSMYPIGIDLSITLNESEIAMMEHLSPYLGGNFYTPMVYVLLSPLVFPPYRYAYLAITLLSIAAYGISTLWFARRVGAGRSPTTLLLLAVTGLLSYGFQFELERGQFNVIAMTLALVALGLFYWRPQMRLASYLLLTLAIQLKVYPAILLVAFVADWRNWRREALRILGILAANLACLFVLGPRVFLAFLAAILAQMSHPYIWIGNHSALSFASQLSPSHAGPLALAILVVLAACLGYALWRVHARSSPGLDPYLLMVCCLCALVIPSVSHDYTLPLLVAPAAIFFGALQVPDKGQTRAALGIGALFLMSLAYSSTLFSYTNKASLPLVHAGISPILTENALPAILLMLLAATALVALGFARSGEATPCGATTYSPGVSPTDGQ